MAQQPGQVSPDGLWVWTGTQWVPNQSAVQRPAAVRPYESARFRATMTTIFLGVNAIGILLLVAFNGTLIAGAGATPQGSDSAVILAGLVALLALVAYVGSAIPAIVFFCMWNHRVVRNMPALGSPDPRWTPAGAVGRCFIPFLNLLHPLWSVLDAWRGSDPTLRWSYVQARKAVGVPPVIAGWWTAWLAGSWVSNIGGRMASSDTPSVAVSGAWVSILGGLVLIAAAALAIMVVRDLTARQDHKQQLIATGQLR